MADTDRLNDRMRAAIDVFRRDFPRVPITSGYRDLAQNTAAGGAKGSQHLHGNAVDLSLAGLPPDEQLRVLNWWRDQGAGGFGYYPNKNAIHVDFGAPRAWGPDYSKDSLPQTPEFFRNFVASRGTTSSDPMGPMGSQSPLPAGPAYASGGTGYDTPREAGPGPGLRPDGTGAGAVDDPFGGDWLKASSMMAAGAKMMQRRQGAAPMAGIAPQVVRPTGVQPLTLTKNPVLGLLGGPIAGLLGGR